MVLDIDSTPPRRMTEAERLNAACKVAARLEGLPAHQLVSAFLAATLGDVCARDSHFEARGYGFRAVSIRNRPQAVRNWMIKVTAKAATVEIAPTPLLLLPPVEAA